MKFEQNRIVNYHSGSRYTTSIAHENLNFVACVVIYLAVDDDS